MSYTRLYDSALLDDIHNYFPELLYAPERFRTITEVLGYVQEQTRRRFDLFSRGRREFLNTRQPTPIHTPEVSMLFETNMGVPTNSAAELLNAINLMTGIFHGPSVPVQNTMGGNPAGFAAAQSFLNPVIVRPTAEQIASGTAIEIIDSDEEICAVCQDSLTAGTQALNLVACDHRFHSECIRTWFARNVVCPVCRHDIRVPTASPGPNPVAGAP
jgi:hypothetical protein